MLAELVDHVIGIDPDRDRQLNKALHLIVVTRCRVDPDTRA
jgi:hypothetical protein